MFKYEIILSTLKLFQNIYGIIDPKMDIAMFKKNAQIYNINVRVSILFSSSVSYKMPKSY